MGTMNIYNTSGANKASLTFTGSSDVTVDSNNLSGLTSNVQTQLGQMIGVGQTWQNVVGSRTYSVTYTNSTSKPIVVSIAVRSISASQTSFQINGVDVGFYMEDGGSASTSTGTFIIPPGNTYQLVKEVASSTIVFWYELR